MDRIGATSYPAALELPHSLLMAYFESERHKQFSQADEAKGKLFVAVVDRIGSVVSAIGYLARAIGGR